MLPRIRCEMSLLTPGIFMCFITNGFLFYMGIQVAPFVITGYREIIADFQVKIQWKCINQGRLQVRNRESEFPPTKK